MEPNNISQQIEDLNIGIIIPTYNNARTLSQVIDKTLMHTSRIIIVNDGSTDKTKTILGQYPQLEVIHLSENKGKGNALKVGFEKAIEKKYDYAITLDSDGQHFPEDIQVFTKSLHLSPTKELLLIGARNMQQDGVPKKSSFGNKFSNFWFWVETGTWLKDTQSGFRLYPLTVIKDLTLYTKKFEFEIEVIVKASWKGTTVSNVPVQVHYEQENRVSHFRPFKDFTRISVLNTYLVFLTFFYIKPRTIFRNLKKKGIKRFLLEDVLQNQDSPSKKASSIALGIFIGLSPLWGFHTVIVLFLAMVLKLNKAIAFAFSNVSLPPFIPFVVFAGLETGSYVTDIDFPFTLSDIGTNIDFTQYLKTYLIGSFVFSIIAALLVGGISYLILASFSTNKSQVNV